MTAVAPDGKRPSSSTTRSGGPKEHDQIAVRLTYGNAGRARTTCVLWVVARSAPTLGDDGLSATRRCRRMIGVVPPSVRQLFDTVLCDEPGANFGQPPTAIGFSDQPCIHQIESVAAVRQVTGLFYAYQADQSEVVSVGEHDVRATSRVERAVTGLTRSSPHRRKHSIGDNHHAPGGKSPMYRLGTRQ